MKTIIFSDTHLTNKFNEKKFLYLKSIIQSADKVIINGDFWDGYITNANDFYNSSWSKLFPLLKKKNTIYIYGNHDLKEFNQGFEYKYFNNGQEKFELKTKDKIYVLQHGHKLAKTPDVLFNNFPFLKTSFSSKLSRFAHKSLCRCFDINGTKYFHGKLNPVMLKRFNSSSQQYLITGHSHYPALEKENQFANSGFIDFGYGNYLKIENSEIELIQEKY